MEEARSKKLPNAPAYVPYPSRGSNMGNPSLASNQAFLRTDDKVEPPKRKWPGKLDTTTFKQEDIALQPLKPLNIQTFENTSQNNTQLGSSAYEFELNEGIPERGTVNYGTGFSVVNQYSSFPKENTSGSVNENHTFEGVSLNKVSFGSNTSEETFYEASAVIENSPHLDEAVIPEIVDPSVFDDGGCFADSVSKYYPTLLTENYCPVVEVNLPPHMKGPLLDNDAVLDLSPLFDSLVNVHTAAPLCSLQEFREDSNDEARLISILEVELDALELEYNVETYSSVWQKLKSKTGSIFSRPEDYYVKYPWAIYVQRPNTAESSAQDETQKSDDEFDLDAIFHAIYS